jgi:hypothetical protein
MRCARWVINDPYYTPGERIQNLNNSKIPGSFLVILSFIGVFAFIWSGKTFVKLFKRWRNKKNLAFL